MDLIETPIAGLKIKLNKVVGDERGYLFEAAPGGKDNDFLIDGIGNIYVSTATQKGIARGGHYHKKLVENFYTISGIALWLFKDFRKRSKTFGETYAVVLGEKEEIKSLSEIPAYLLPDSLAQVWVPKGVYHAYYPLSKKRVTVIAIASLPHDDQDYVRIKPEDDPDLSKILQKVKL